MTDIKQMKLGQLVDFCLSYNERQEASERQAEREASGKRWATQAEIDAFCG